MSATGAEPDHRRSIQLDPVGLRDVEQLLTGGYAPLVGFVDEQSARQVRATGTLPDGTRWPVPITLPVGDDDAALLGVGDQVTLRDPDGTRLATLDVTSRWQGDDGRWWVGGPVAGIRTPHPRDFPDLRDDVPTIATHLARGDGPVVALQPTGFVDTCTVARLRRALDALDARALVLPPVGADHERRHVHRIRSYVALVPELGAARTHLRLLASARHTEDLDAAALHGAVARNAGATHLAIVDEGRDLQAARRAGLLPVDLSEHAAVGDDPPGSYAAEIDLARRRADPPRHERGVVVVLTGLSGSGKSTIAGILRARLLEEGTRQVTLLDGDLVRQHLSSELGFSREHRDLNVTRIGYVASEIAKHGGIAVCAPIAPYDAVRKRIRAMAEQAGAGFVLVHVATPLEVCEARDVKGLYAKARAGELRGFTGVDDPYEVPDDAELVLDTTTTSPEDAAATIVATLTQAGWHRQDG